MSALTARTLVFFASAAVLVLEILAGRVVAPYVGVTLQTFTGIIGVVLTGIAAGAWAGGRIADRIDPRPLIGPLLGVSGILAMAAPLIVDSVGPSMRAAGPLEIVVLTVSAFFLPATTLSAIPPIVVKIRLRSLDETGSVVGSLSALGTIGALAATFFTGFVLVAAVPTRPLILGTGALLVVAGIAAAARNVSRRTTVIALLATAGSVASLGAVRGPCQYQTTYFCAVVEVDAARPTGRMLWLDSLTHSYVDTADPTYLRFRYAQTVADVVSARSERPLTAAYIGGGGFTLPRYFAAKHPGSTAVVFEIDRPLVALARDELGLRTSDALRVETGDARLRLPRHASDSFDFVMGDAFGGLSVPWHLTTREFVEEIDRVLADDGVYIVNVIDYPPLRFARAEAATMRSVFRHVAVVAPLRALLGERGSNLVLVGSQHPLPVAAIQARLAQREEEQMIWVDQTADQFVGDARVLTDDFAPVDQLLTLPPR